MTFRQQKWKIFSRRVLTLKIASAQAVRTSINFPSQDTFPDNQISSRHTTPKLKPISWNKHYAQYPWVLRWSLEKKRVNLCIARGHFGAIVSMKIATMFKGKRGKSFENITSSLHGPQRFFMGNIILPFNRALGEGVRDCHKLDHEKYPQT